MASDERGDRPVDSIGSTTLTEEMDRLVRNEFVRAISRIAMSTPTGHHPAENIAFFLGNSYFRRLCRILIQGYRARGVLGMWWLCPRPPLPVLGPSRRLGTGDWELPMDHSPLATAATSTAKRQSQFDETKPTRNIDVL